MITREVNEWIKKVRNGYYSYNTAMEEFEKFSMYLTKEEIRQVLNNLKKG